MLAVTVRLGKLKESDFFQRCELNYYFRQFFKERGISPLSALMMRKEKKHTYSTSLVINHASFFHLFFSRERFLVYRAVTLLVVSLSCVVVTQPQLFVSFPMELRPVFSLDLTFGFPAAADGRDERAANADPAANGFLVFVALGMVPVLAAYLGRRTKFQSAPKYHGQYYLYSLV